jgi:hypothetical protein
MSSLSSFISKPYSVFRIQPFTKNYLLNKSTGNYIKVTYKNNNIKSCEVNKSVFSLPDGLYTFIITLQGQHKDIYHVRYSRVNPLEIGSTHMHLIAYTSPDCKLPRFHYPILLGGELIKHGNKVKFNLLSGTFSAKTLTPQLMNTRNFQNLIKQQLLRNNKTHSINNINYTKNILIPNTVCLNLQTLKTIPNFNFSSRIQFFNKNNKPWSQNKINQFLNPGKNSSVNTRGPRHGGVFGILN